MKNNFSKKIKGQITLAMMVLIVLIITSLLSVYIFEQWNILFRGYKSQAAIQGLAEKVMARVKSLALYGSSDLVNCGEFANNTIPYKNVFNKIRNFNNTNGRVWKLGEMQTVIINPDDRYGSAIDYDVGLPAFNQNGWLYGCIITLQEAENVLWKPSGGWNNNSNDQSIRVEVSMSGSPDFLNLSREVTIAIELDGVTENGAKAGTYSLKRSFQYRVPIVNDFGVILQRTSAGLPKITLNNTGTIRVNFNSNVLVITERNRYTAGSVGQYPLFLESLLGTPAELFRGTDQRTPLIIFNESFLTTARHILPGAIGEMNTTTAGSNYTGFANISEYNPRVLHNIFKKGIETGVFDVRENESSEKINEFNLPKFNSSVLNDPQFHIINDYEGNPDPALRKIQPIPYYPIVDSGGVVHDCVSETNSARCGKSDYHWMLHPVGVPNQSRPHIIPSHHAPGATEDPLTNEHSGIGLVKLSDSCVREFKGPNASIPTDVGQTFVFQRASEDLTIRFEAGQEIGTNSVPGGSGPAFIFCGMVVARKIIIHAPESKSRIQMLGTFIANEIEVTGAGGLVIQFNNPKDNKQLLVNVTDIPTRTAGNIDPPNYYNKFYDVDSDMLFSSQSELYKQWHNHFRDTAANFFVPLSYMKNMEPAMATRFNSSPFIARVPSHHPNPPSSTNTNVPCYGYEYFGKFLQYQYVIDGDDQHNTPIPSDAKCTFVDRIDPNFHPLAAKPPNHLIDENIIKYNGCDETLSGPLQNSWTSPDSFESKVVNKTAAGYAPKGLYAGTFNADYCYPHKNPNLSGPYHTNYRLPAYGGGEKLMPNYYVYYVRSGFENTLQQDRSQSRLGDGKFIPGGPGEGNDPAAGVHGGRWRNLETQSDPPYFIPGGPTLWLNFAPNVYTCKRSDTNFSQYQGLPAPYNNACVFKSSNYGSFPMTNVTTSPLSSIDRYGFCDCYGSNIADGLFWVMEKSL